MWTAYSVKEIDVDDVKGHFILDKVILCSPFMVILTGLTAFDMDDIMGHNLIWRGMTRRCHGCFNWFEEFQKGD